MLSARFPCSVQRRAGIDGGQPGFVHSRGRLDHRVLRAMVHPLSKAFAAFGNGGKGTCRCASSGTRIPHAVGNRHACSRWLHVLSIGYKHSYCTLMRSALVLNRDVFDISPVTLLTRMTTCINGRMQARPTSAKLTAPHGGR